MFSIFLQQNVCKEADSKREDMKWLVQTLDSLTSHCPETQALQEQKLLEALIIRYKNLIPSLEITMVKTDTLSKCYTYRREVREVCQLLKQVREQSKLQRQPESLEIVTQNIRKQEMAISHLDQQRPNVMSLLQRGKELSRDENAPSFMPEEVKSLESGWTTTYDETVDTLHKLIDTHHVWTNFSEQKQEIISVLQKAEQDLQKTSQAEYTSTVLPTELIKKQEMIINLRDAQQDMLNKLNYFSENLSKQVPEQKAKLDTEVKEIEQRITDTLSNVQENVTLLEQYNTKWNTLSSTLGQLHSWTVHEAPQLLTSIDVYSITPKDRVEKTELLKSEVSNKMKVLHELNQQATNLLVTNSPDAQKLKGQIAEIQEKVALLNQNIESQSAIVSDDYKNWEMYQANLQEITPWIENSEIKLQSGLQKPSTLEEAIQIQSQAKQFQKEVDQQQDKLQGVASLTQKISIQTHAPDEVDSIQTRVSVIQDTAAQWGQKLDKLVANWLDFDKNVQHLENWIVKSEESLSAKPVNLKTPNVDKLEKELAKLKAFNNEISEQQAKLISLTQSSDSISYNISPEGAAEVKNQVQELKSKVSKLADSTRARINEISDAILVKHDFETKIADYNNWLEAMKANISQLDEIPSDKVDSTIINIHTLLQEHSDKQPLFNTIYSEIKEIAVQSPQKAMEPLTEEYSTLVKQNQEIEHKLQEKRTQLQKWSELLNWHTETMNQLSHIKYQSDAEKLNPEELKKLITETDNVLEKVITWKENTQTISKSDIVILDKQTGLPRTPENVVREIEVTAINLKEQLANKVDNLQNLMQQRNHFAQLQQEATADINKTKAQLVEINNQVKHSSDLPKAVEQLNNLLEAQVAKSAIKDKLHSEAMQLMKKDIQNVSTIQNSLSEIERGFNKVNDDIRDEHLKLSDVIYAWNDFQEAKDRIVTDIGKIDKSIENLELPNDLFQATVNCEKAKKALEAIKKSRSALDKADSKAQTVIKKAENIPGVESEVKRDLKILNDAWSKIYERILKTVQKTESQAAIWKHIDDTKTTLLQWLSEQNNEIIKAAEKPNEKEVANAKLSKYREELPAQQRLCQSIPQKIVQLQESSDGKEIPTLQSLVTLLSEGFSTLEENAKQLEALTSTFNENEKIIRKNIKDTGNKVSALREEIVKCEDLSGDNMKILERLIKIKSLKQELQNYDINIKKIEEDIQTMKVNYPNFENTLTKEQQLLKKRFDTTITHADKIENSLLSFLKKFHNEKYGALQRIINAHKEKIQWCLPESTSDKYNLQVKLNALEPIQAVLIDCDKRKQELKDSIAVLEQIEKPESVKLQKAELDHLLFDLENLNQQYTDTKNILENNISLHDKYEQLSESVANWLKDTENRVKAESSLQMDMNKIDNKLKEITALHQEVKDYQQEIDKLIPLSEELTKQMPESRIGPFVQHLNSRYQGLNKFLAHYIEKLNELNKYKSAYKTCIQDVENWLVKAQEKVNTFSKSAKKPNRTILEELKNFAQEKEVGQTLLARAVEHGEALFPGITPENRDTIRAELRNLRDKSEVLIDKVNTIYKQVEANLMQRHSFDDSLQQVKLWIDDAELKLGDEVKLDATLLDKKQTLHNYKILSQDVNLHKTILKQLQEKIGNLSDADAENKLEENLQKYNKLANDVEKRIEVAEEFVSNHEVYNQAIEKCRDWLSALTTEAALIVDETSTESPETKLAIVENLLSQKEEGDKIINSCKQQLETVLKQTAAAGHPPLINNFEEQEKSWQRFLELCQEAQEKLNEIQNQYSEVSNIMDDLESWLKSRENFVKDQSLKNTENTKKAHLEKLEVLEKEVQQKEPDFNRFLELSKSLAVDGRISQIPTRYQSLRNAVKENRGKYENFVKEHHDFNIQYNEFLQWLTTKEEDLQNFSQIVGDLTVLQSRQKDIKDLIDERNQRISEFENLVDKGEKLYAHTSPDGREIIRQQLKNLRTIWDTLTEDLQGASNKLEQCLTQFSDFTATQEQLTKWLKDVEKAMHQHTELKSTLQEKRAQLQNHKIMHQEITSHQQLVAQVCDKAQQLVDQTQDKSLNIYLQSIKQLFLNIVSKSEELLKNLEECVDRHTSYNQLITDFKKWIGDQNERLLEFVDTTGEKSEINKRIENIHGIKRDSETKGPQLLENLKQNVIAVAKSTAPKGVETLKRELATLEELLQNHLELINNTLDNQNEALKQWDEFESALEALNQWSKAVEADFRDQPLQVSLADKENKLKQLQKQREEISAKEKEIDDFVDKSHALLKTSGSQKIKQITSQISNKFQNLHSLTKDIVNRWQNIVDDHKKYKQRLEETSAWLVPLEEHLKALQEGHLGDSAEANNRLQVLLTEAEQGEHKLNSLSLLGERLLPDTATDGRDIIRSEIKAIRDRWENLAESK